MKKNEELEILDKQLDLLLNLGISKKDLKEFINNKLK